MIPSHVTPVIEGYIQFLTCVGTLTAEYNELSNISYCGAVLIVDPHIFQT